MAALELRRSDGSTEVRELSRSQPLTIGRQQFNDVCVPEAEVAPMHCRVSWNKSTFEVTAATTAGVAVNSSTVTHADLKPGDVIRVGGLELIFQNESAAAKAPPPLDLPGSRRSRVKAEPVEKRVEDLSMFDGSVNTESQAMMESLFADDELAAEPVARQPSSVGGGGLLMQSRRPGEQEILKSPLVLALIVGALVLLLVTGIFWFLIAREHSNKLYDVAVREMNDGQFAQAIASFEKFIQQYPNHAQRRHAELGLAKGLILKEISGATPAWNRGLERLHEFIKGHRSESGFADLHSILFQIAEQISLGSLKSAETSRDPALLVISKEAQDLLERYADPAISASGTLGRINDQRVKAERAINKQSTFDIAMKSVDMAIADRKPMLALSERERLIRQVPDFVSTKRVKDALQKSLDLERSMVATDESERPAEAIDEAPVTSEPILGLLHTRSRTDDISQGRVVFVLARDSCFAIDPATGELIWRRVIGFRSPFFPVQTAGAQPSVLLFDVRNQALLACQLSTGKLIWKQRLKARAVDGPLVHEGQIYLPLEGQSLVRLDVDTGRLTATVRFSQNLATSPILSRDENHLLVPGEMAMIYALTLRATSTQQPLTAVATTFTDHSAGSISVPPLMMGRLLLLCENDRAESANLRLWDAGKPTESLVELASTRCVGQVRDVPVLRGNQLVVPSNGEQFSAYAVTDETGRAGISAIGQYRADQSREQNRVEPASFVALGPDGQFWSAGSAFRRFEIGPDSIRMDSNSTAPGIASQPLQRVGEQFFVGRKSRVSNAVTFSSIDRERLVNPWRCIVGDAPLEMAALRGGGAMWVAESGTLYTIGPNRMAQGGVDLKAGADLDLPLNLTLPVRASALHDQRLVLIAAGETTQLFVFNTAGQIDGKYPLTGFPEADPVLLDEGLILALPGRLKFLPLVAGKKPLQDWIAPIGEGEKQRWAHVIGVDGRELIACDGTGRLTRIQARAGDVPHLAEVARLQLDNPVDVRPFLRGEFLYVADTEGTLRQLNVRSFDIDGQRTLPRPVRNVWPAGANLIVEAGDRTLHCLADGKMLPQQWTCTLKDLEPTGSILLKGETLWIACRNGTVLCLNSANGAEIRRIVLPQSLSLGIRQFQESVFAVASDGTLYRME
jgi:outer membrane protein assembly factor BamB